MGETIEDMEKDVELNDTKIILFADEKGTPKEKIIDQKDKET